MANIPNFSKKFNVILKTDSNGAMDVPDYTTEVGLNRLLKGTARSLRAITAGFLILGGLLAATPAQAEELDPSTFAYTIAGTFLQDDVPIPGVKVTASLDDFSASAESNEFGEWSIMVPELGQYKVEIDQSTIPEGFALTDPENGAVGNADLSETDFAAVLFSFGADTTVRASFSDQLLARVFAGLNFGLLLAIASIGISLIYGTTGLNNFAHGEMVSLGALVMWVTYIIWDQNILLAALFSIAVVTAFGWSQDAGIWKPLRKRRMGLNQMMIVSIGFSIVARYLMLLFFGGGTKDIGGGGEIVQLGPIFTSDITLVGMVINVIALAGVALFLTRTRIGKATRAVSDNPSLAAATGIDVERIIRIVWLFAAALTGVAGVLYGLQFQASWQTGFDILLLLFAAVTLGGLGTALGATVGALIIGMVVEVSTLFIPNELKYAAALVILVIILIVRPQGVLGKKQRIG
jgi:branched-chain amino acid transport system permease protein